MLQKLEYLKKYTMRKNGYVRLIPFDEIPKINSLPNTWYEIFKEKDKKKKINTLFEIWNKYLSTELSNTISYLRQYTIDVELMEINDRFSILYTIKNSKGEVFYYEGRRPHENFNNEKLEESWKKIPASIQAFYENIHNGFYYYASGAMGLVPLENVTYLGEDDFDWNIIDDLEEPMQIDLNTSFGFFSNGMGTYVAIDYNNCDNNNATLWSAKTQPKYNINFWDFVDEWIVIGFDT